MPNVHSAWERNSNRSKRISPFLLDVSHHASSCLSRTRQASSLHPLDSCIDAFRETSLVIPERSPGLGLRHLRNPSVEAGFDPFQDVGFLLRKIVFFPHVL